MALQHTRTDLRLPDETEEAALRLEYAARSCVTFPGFLEASLLRRLQRRLSGPWHTLVHDLGEPATDRMLDDPTLAGALALLTHDPALHSLVRRVTGCDPIGCFHGRVYRMDPHAGHHDVWHGDDDDDNRLLALSVNLSSGQYAGGVLELRERAGQRLLHRVANTGPGDAILFRIDHALEHRVTDVEGKIPKIAYAGWFQREPVIGLGGLVRR